MVCWDAYHHGKPSSKVFEQSASCRTCAPDCLRTVPCGSHLLGSAKLAFYKTCVSVQCFERYPVNIFLSWGSRSFRFHDRNVYPTNQSASADLGSYFNSLNEKNCKRTISGDSCTWSQPCCAACTVVPWYIFWRMNTAELYRSWGTAGLSSRAFAGWALILPRLPSDFPEKSSPKGTRVRAWCASAAHIPTIISPDYRNNSYRTWQKNRPLVNLSHHVRKHSYRRYLFLTKSNFLCIL